jgi:hypothetical protein
VTTQSLIDSKLNNLSVCQQRIEGDGRKRVRNQKEGQKRAVRSVHIRMLSCLD